jgi:dolichol-phosphate mannosyltransferase
VDVLVVMPTYNERENLPELVRAVLALPGYRVLVVDDGSPDGTGAVADELAREFPGRVEVLHRTGPRGLGRSYVDGLRHALRGDAADVHLPDGRRLVARPRVPAAPGRRDLEGTTS